MNKITAHFHSVPPIVRMAHQNHSLALDSVLSMTSGSVLGGERSVELVGVRGEYRQAVMCLDY